MQGQEYAPKVLLILLGEWGLGLLMGLFGPDGPIRSMDLLDLRQ